MKLTPLLNNASPDELALRVGLTDKGKVYLAMGIPVDGIALEPNGALELARLLRDAARKANRAGPQRTEK